MRLKRQYPAMEARVAKKRGAPYGIIRAYAKIESFPFSLFRRVLNQLNPRRPDVLVTEGQCIHKQLTSEEHKQPNACEEGLYIACYTEPKIALTMYVKQVFLFTIFAILVWESSGQGCTSLVPPTTVNGVMVTATSTGSVETYAPTFTSCTNPGYTTPANSVWLGAFGASADNCNNPFTYTLNFSEPVSGFQFVLTAAGAGGNENFIFTPNTGTALLSDLGSCDTVINGNELVSGETSDSAGGGGEFSVTGSEPFTSITISGNGCYNGSLFAICSETLTPPTLVADALSSGDACIGDDSPLVTLIASGGESPYTINYTINGGNLQSGIANDGVLELNVATATANSFTYTVVSITDAVGNSFEPNNATVTVNISAPVTPSFAPIGPFCSGAVIAPFPTTSTNGVTGSWSPDVNNTATTTYTFTPAPGECSNTTTAIVEVNALEPSFTMVDQVCVDEPVVATYNGTSTLPPSFSWSASGGTFIGATDEETATVSFDSEGSYTVSLTATTAGCEATQTATIEALGSIVVITEANSCESYQWNNELLTESGTYVIESVNDTGCLTVEMLELTIHLPDASITEASGCDAFTWNGESFTQSGTYVIETATVFGCDSTATLDLTLHQSVQISFDTLLCMGEGLALPDGSLTFESGTYSTVLQTMQGCDSVVTVSVSFLDPPSNGFYAEPQTTNLLEGEVTFFADVTGLTSYQWDFGDWGMATTEEATIVFDQVGNHTICLSTASELGCSGTTCRTYTVNDLFEVFIPNAFTPDGDGVNEVFRVSGTNIDDEEFLMQIFNRWGALVFETRDVNGFWNGSAQQSGAHYGQNEVYLYRVEVKDRTTANKSTYKGHVVLIR